MNRTLELIRDYTIGLVAIPIGMGLVSRILEPSIHPNRASVGFRTEYENDSGHQVMILSPII